MTNSWCFASLTFRQLQLHRWNSDQSPFENQTLFQGLRKWVFQSFPVRSHAAYIDIRPNRDHFFYKVYPPEIRRHFRAPLLNAHLKFFYLLLQLISYRNLLRLSATGGWNPVCANDRSLRWSSWISHILLSFFMYWKWLCNLSSGRDISTSDQAFADCVGLLIDRFLSTSRNSDWQTSNNEWKPGLITDKSVFDGEIREQNLCLTVFQQMKPDRRELSAPDWIRIYDRKTWLETKRGRIDRNSKWLSKSCRYGSGSRLGG